MNDRRLEQLAQMELDGTSTPERSRKLQALLSGSEEARMRYEEIRSVFRILDAQRPIEPPASLKSNVLRSVERRRPAPAPSGWRSRLATTLRFERPLGALTAFAVGALVASVLTVAALRVARDGNGGSISGTMGGGAGALVDQQSLELNDGSVACAASRAGERVVVRVSVHSRTAVSVALESGAPHVRWIAVRPLAGGPRCTIAEGSVEIEAPGNAEAVVELTAPREAGPLQWRARATGVSNEKRSTLKLN